METIPIVTVVEATPPELIQLLCMDHNHARDDKGKGEFVLLFPFVNHEKSPTFFASLKEAYWHTVLDHDPTTETYKDADKLMDDAYALFLEIVSDLRESNVAPFSPENLIVRFIVRDLGRGVPNFTGCSDVRFELITIQANSISEGWLRVIGVTSVWLSYSPEVLLPVPRKGKWNLLEAGSCWVSFSGIQGLLQMPVQPLLMRSSLHDPRTEQYSAPDYDMTIHQNPDPRAWVAFFRECNPQCSVPDSTMLGWFSNAMMAMHDHVCSKGHPLPLNGDHAEFLLNTLNPLPIPVRG
jgi:hypothetical protein